MSEPFGPFRTQCGPVERRAQLRALEALVRVLAGPLPVVGLMRKAEAGDPVRLSLALAAFDTIPTLTRRRILASFAYLHGQEYTSACATPQEAPHEVVR